MNSRKSIRFTENTALEFADGMLEAELQHGSSFGRNFLAFASTAWPTLVVDEIATEIRVTKQ